MDVGGFFFDFGAIRTPRCSAQVQRATDQIQGVVNLTGNIAGVSKNLADDAEHRMRHIKAVSAPSTSESGSGGGGGNGGKGGALHQKVRNARFAEGTDSKGTVTTRINGTFEKIQSYGHRKGSAAN